MADKLKLPDAIREQIAAQKLNLEETAAHLGVGPTEFANTYDLSDVIFPERTGADAQAEAPSA